MRKSEKWTEPTKDFGDGLKRSGKVLEISLTS